MSPSVAERPVYLHDSSEPIFGFFHAPESASPTGMAVLICAPFAWDDVSSYRPRREWARQLAGAGHPALRFDWPGTGDSGGSPRDPGRLDAWTDAVGAAATWLRATTGSPRVAAIGLGLGGLVVWRAVAQGAPVDDLVLWAVPARGRKFVRELEMFGRLQAANAPAGAPEKEPLSEGVVQAGGFLFTAETRASIEALDVRSMPLAPGPGRRVLLLDRDGLAVEPGLREALDQAGAEVAHAPGPGYGLMTAGPQEACPPREVFTQVSAWLGEAPTLDYAPSPLALEGPESIELEVDGARIRETPFSVDQPFGRLFGVLAEPVGPRADVSVVLLNAGAIRRIGPNRMWVEMARRSAARGVPTLRLDLEGIGDADGDAGRYADVAELYVPELVDQVRDALGALTTRGFAPRFILGGLCSGAYWSFHAALEDDRVLAAFLVNPKVLFWDASVSVAREARRVRELLQLSSWRRILRGEVPVRRGVRMVRALGGSIRVAGKRQTARLLTRGRAGPAPEDLLDEALARLRDAHKRVVLVFGGEEELRDELERDGHLARLEGFPNLELDFVPGAPHTLSPVWAQHQVHALFERTLTRELDAPRG